MERERDMIFIPTVGTEWLTGIGTRDRSEPTEIVFSAASFHTSGNRPGRSSRPNTEARVFASSAVSRFAITTSGFSLFMSHKL
jgi:hypothetical protein